MKVKEYPIMARSNSTPGSKTSRAKTNKPQAEVPAVPEANSLVATDAEIAPVVTAPVSEPIAEGVSKTEHSSGPNGHSDPKGNSERHKFELMKSETTKADSRKNLVPINLEDEIRSRAYEIYEQRGAGSGNEAEDWLTAEREVRQRYRQQSA
jgi:hypothetical protein